MTFSATKNWAVNWMGFSARRAGSSRDRCVADRYPRKLLLVLILLVGGAASLGTALARSYSDLFWMRALTGVSLGSALPVTFSLVGDMFAPSQRTAASGRVGVAMSAGVGFGQAMSGFLGAALDSWRAPFVVVGVCSSSCCGGRLDCVRRAAARRLR